MPQKYELPFSPKRASELETISAEFSYKDFTFEALKMQLQIQIAAEWAKIQSLPPAKAKKI